MHFKRKYIYKKVPFHSIIAICDYSHCRGLFLEDVGFRQCVAIIKVLFDKGSIICDCAIVQDLATNYYVHLRLKLSQRQLIVLRSYLNVYVNCSGFNTACFFIYRLSVRDFSVYFRIITCHTNVQAPGAV